MYEEEYAEYMREKQIILENTNLEEESCKEKRRKGLTTFCIQKL